MAKPREKPREKSKSVEYKEQVWYRQHAALQSQFYRLTLRGRGERDGKVMNFGKLTVSAPEIDPAIGFTLLNARGKPEILWTVIGVRNKIPSLEYWNWKGFDIYLTPIDAYHHYILLDDLTETGKNYVQQHYAPCVIQLSSENNYQAVLRIPKSEKSHEEQSCANILLQELNQGLPDGYGGDKQISGAIHAFRLSGFCNKKPGRNNTQTKIELVKDTDCPVASQLLEDIKLRRRREREREEEQAKSRRITVAPRTAQLPETDADRDFRSRWNRIFGLASQKVAEGLWVKVDASTIDYRVCQELLQQGYSEREIAAALFCYSPDLCLRHWAPEDYVERTVSAARQSILQDEPQR